MELEESARYWKLLEARKLELKILDNTIHVRFLPENFFHVIGLQHLKDLKSFFREKYKLKNKIGHAILDTQNNGEYVEKIKNSSEYKIVKERCYFINRILWAFSMGSVEIIKNCTSEGSLLTGDYLFQFEVHKKVNNVVNKNTLYLILKHSDENYYVVNSFFSNENPQKFKFGGQKTNVISMKIT